MSQQELLSAIVRTLDACEVPYTLAGSVVSSLQGEPRATHDIDIVVDLRSESGSRLFEALSRLEGYVDEVAVRRALSTQGMFNYIDDATGLKVDFWILKSHAYDQESFGRRRRESLLGVDASVLAPEDTILSKLRWAKLSGGSEKQFRDALRVYEVQLGILDRGYLDRWARELGVREEWDRLVATARPVDP